MDILNPPDVAGFYTQFIHLPAVKFHILIYILHLLHQTLALKRVHLVSAHTLDLRIPDRFFPVFYRYSCHLSILLF